MADEVRCAGCDSIIPSDSSLCPKCGDVRKVIAVSVKTEARLIDELGMQARDEGDRLLREYQSRADGTKDGIIDRDLSGPDEVIRRSGRRSKALVNFDEETKYVESFVSAFNQHLGRAYEVEPKPKEDSDFPDRWLIDGTIPLESPDHKVGVEVTHLDQKAIAELNRDELFAISGSIESIVDSAANAVLKKHKIEPEAASRTYLLLTCPYSIPPTMQDDFRNSFLVNSPKQYFREVWVASFKEPAFRIL
jgi:hypothetical protein